MPENSLFQSQVLYDFPTHLEFQRAAVKGSTSQLIGKIILSVLLLLMIATILFSGYRQGGLVLSLYILLIWAISFYRIHWGASYKRTLTANMGQPQMHCYYFCEDVVLECTAEDAITARITYDQVQRVIESKHLYILNLKHRINLIVCKATLTGEAKEDFLSFLHRKCPKWKKSTPKRGTAGQVADCILGFLTVVTLILSLINTPILRLPISSHPDIQAGSLTNDLSYQDMAEELATVGVVISQQTIAELEDFDADYLEEYGIPFYEDQPYENKVLDLLYWEAAGFYDETTWQWTPSTSGLYYFDLEVWDVSSIYTDFFTGLCAMNRDMSFSNYHEDWSKVDLEAGTGEIDIRFVYAGTPYAWTAEAQQDWFDTTILAELGAILRSDDKASNLYVYYDGQGCLLYYGTEEHRAQLENLTGIPFRDATDSLSYN